TRRSSDLGLPVASDAAALAAGCDVVLGHRDGALSLWHPGGPETPLCVDFAGGKTGYRVAADRVRHEKLVRAAGNMPENGVVIDATAGLGRDAAVLAAAGWQVVLLERQPVLHAGLWGGLRRAGALSLRMTLGQAGRLCGRGPHPEVARVVYLEPMSREREKSAAITKDLAWLKQLCPIDAEAGEAAL